MTALDPASRSFTALSALAAARELLLSLQSPAGWWKGELETNVTMDAEDLMLRQFLGILTNRDADETARWIRSKQRQDGTWANSYAGPADLSTSVEAYAALRLAGDQADAEHMRRAADYIRGAGGIETSRCFTRIWLAMLGQWSWTDLPVMPPELMFLPNWFPLNIYHFQYSARLTIVPLTIVSSLRPVRAVAFTLDELLTGRPQSRAAPVVSWGGLFTGLDRLLHAYERRPLSLLRRAALRRAAEWILARQENDGSWGGVQAPWVFSLVALHLLGYELDHPVMQRGIAGLDRFTIREESASGPVRRFEACQSPVWDTVLSMSALVDAGLPADHCALIRAADWIVGEQVRGPGDWTLRRPDLPPGGWAFEFDNDCYPDVDDTAEAILALRRVRHPTRSADLDAAIARGVRWLSGMASRDGGFGPFDVDNTGRLCTKLPFCDFGEVIEPPAADLTAHVLEALATEGRADSPIARRAIDWLLKAQEPDGSWFGRWGVNHIYGTGAVVPALIAANMRVSAPPIRRAVSWLHAHQNNDGGWGEDVRSYHDPQWIGRGESTPSQTAWALLALIAAGEGSDEVERGINWLVHNQLQDGSWDEPYFTGTGFPLDFYINYHLYRVIFPLSALGRYIRMTEV